MPLDETFTVEHPKLLVERPRRKIQTNFTPFSETSEKQSGINRHIICRYGEDDVDHKEYHGRQICIGTYRSILGHDSDCKIAASKNCRNYRKRSDDSQLQSLEGRKSVEHPVTKYTTQTSKDSVPKHEFNSPNISRRFISESSKFPFPSNLSVSHRVQSPEAVKREQASIALPDDKHRDLSISSRDSPRNSAGKTCQSLNKSNSKYTDSGFSTFHEDNSNNDNDDSVKEVSILSMKNLQVFNESFIDNTSLLNVTDGLKSPDKQTASETNQKISCWLDEVNAEKQGQTTNRKFFSTERMNRRNSVGSIRLSKEEIQLLETRNEVEFGEVELHKVPFSPGKPKQHWSSSACLLRSPEEELSRSIEKQKCRQTMLNQMQQTIHDRPIIKKCVRKLNIAETFQQMKSCNPGDLLMMDNPESNLKHLHNPDRVKDTKIMSGKRCIEDIDNNCEMDNDTNSGKHRDALDFHLPSKSRRVQSSKKQSEEEQHKRTYIPETLNYRINGDILCSPISCIVRQTDEKGLANPAKHNSNRKENMLVYRSPSPTGKTQKISSFAEQFNQLKSPRARKIIQKCPDSGQKVDQPLLNSNKRSTNEGQNSFNDVTTFDNGKAHDYKDKHKLRNEAYQETVHHYPKYNNSFDEFEDELDDREPCHEDNTFHMDKMQHYRDSHIPRNKVQMNNSDRYLVDEQRYKKSDKQHHYRKGSQNYIEKLEHPEKNRQCGRDQWLQGQSGYEKEDEADSVHNTAEYLVNANGDLTFQQQSCSENPEGLVWGSLHYEDRKVPNKQIGMGYKHQRYFPDESIEKAQRHYVEMDSNKKHAEDMARDFRSPHRLGVAYSKQKKSPKSQSCPSNRHFINASSHSLPVTNHLGDTFGHAASYSGRKNQVYHKQFMASVDNAVSDDDDDDDEHERKVQKDDNEYDEEPFDPNTRRNRRNGVRGLHTHRLENGDREKESQNKWSNIHEVENQQIRNQRKKGYSMTPESHKHMKKDGTASFDSPSINREHRCDAFSPSVSMAKLRLNTPTGNSKRPSVESLRNYSTSSGQTGIAKSLEKGSESNPKSERNEGLKVYSQRNDLSPATRRYQDSHNMLKKNQSQVLAKLNLLQERELEECNSEFDGKVRGQGQWLTLKNYQDKGSDLSLKHSKEYFGGEGFISLDKLSKTAKKFRINKCQFFKTEVDKELSQSFMNVIDDLDNIDQASSDDEQETLNDSVKSYKQYYQKVVKKSDICESEKENSVKYVNNSKLHSVKTDTKDRVSPRKNKSEFSRKYRTIQSEGLKVARNKNNEFSHGTTESVVKNLPTVKRADHLLLKKDLRGLSGQGRYHGEANFKDFYQSTPVKTGSMLQLNETMSTIFGSEGTEKQEEDEIILI